MQIIRSSHFTKGVFVSRYLELQKKDHIGFVTINRPDKLNAYNTDLLVELAELLSIISATEDIRVVVLQSSGTEAFIAGADISEVVQLNQIGYRKYVDKFIRVWETIENLTQPVIAKVAGYAFGGGCLTTLSCDLVMAAENAKFGQQEINFGILGGPAVLPRIVGRYKAAEIVMLGEVFDAHEAYRIGIVNRIVPLDKLDEATLEIAAKMAKKPKLALQMAKYSLRIGYTEHAAIARQYERDLACLAFGDDEGKRNMQRFLSKKG
jgi:enoyl-CoA hydratase